MAMRVRRDTTASHYGHSILIYFNFISFSAGRIAYYIEVYSLLKLLKLLSLSSDSV